ncbi:hypothetical protein BMJ29_33460 [Sinorhizobium medicae]|uniref:Uncharacterized protein n=1 Tax=Sinorhizobium medicae TaxID=110321 RepID=A0ABX4TC94_9HYPH|nr:hypothetical protein BMJ33_32320 [Sinorhizobium medicae]PLU12093.1 hypothetical protein BMJ29_33460 [Sinorhizobium medicae]PLU23136.1 hypothetical protein BMJ30_03265 [Sinorhizobium medicae]PLU36665.1 hypothetical protein BMJ27_09840 [Sinorhizobium medicae]PLU74859.1 hypothetical protein BMJ19_35410 [Sinorhizobium medicae]
MLQRVSGCLPSTVEIGAIVCHAFDVLYLVGRKLRRLPLHERRHCWSRSSPGQAQAARMIINAASRKRLPTASTAARRWRWP